MSTTLGHKFNVFLSNIRQKQELSRSDLSLFETSLTVERTEPKQILKAPEQVTDDVEEINDKVRIEETIRKFTNFIEAAEQMQQLLGEKLKNRRVKVDAKVDPAVRNAIRRLFGIDSDTITYDMYKQALEIRTRLIAEGRAKVYGPRTTDS